MRKVVVAIVIILLIIFVDKNIRESSEKKNPAPVVENENNQTTISPSVFPKNITSRTSIFVPYWSVAGDTSDVKKYDEAIYFGITANEKGIDTQESGYKNLKNFINDENIKGEKYLTLRMLDTNANLEILEKKDLQQKIIKSTLEIAKANNFDGVVLDLEMSSILPVTDLSKQINSFVNNFSDESKKSNLKIAMTVYGDTFYRGRPYDLKYISSKVDNVLIMAYDFTKSYGEPGPNFPFQGKLTYGYDFKTMIDDFSQVVPTEKLTVIFGMFGYDWTLSSSNQPLKAAESLSVNKIEQQFINSCAYENCIRKNDRDSLESVITYKDKDSRQHVIWYESAESVARKIQFLKEKGIGSVSYWAEGYF